MSTKHLLICDACSTEVSEQDKFLRGGLPPMWMSVSKDPAASPWHVCSWDCLRSFGDRMDREKKEREAALERRAAQDGMHQIATGKSQFDRITPHAVDHPKDWGGTGRATEVHEIHYGIGKPGDPLPPDAA